MDKGTISFLNLKKVNIEYKDEINNDVLISDGEIFNIPFNLTWKQDPSKSEQITNLKFKKINLYIKFFKIFRPITKSKLQINLNRSRYVINYNFNNQSIDFSSNNSFIGNNKFIFSGKIFSDPFNFDIKSSLDSLSLKKLLFNNLFLKEILSEDFILNENFNGKINLNIKNLKKKSTF